MQPLLRPEFRLKLWSPADLDAAADHWLWLFDQAPATAGRDADHRTELRLRGVPKAEREAVAAALATRVPGFEVTKPDADTLTGVGPPLDFDAAPPAGLGVSALAGPPFDGLYLEVRFTLTARKRNGTPHAAGTLVLAGELGPQGYTAYAVWAEGANAALNQQAREVPWADEQAWRADFENFRANLPVVSTAVTLAKKLFPEPPGWFGKTYAWLVQFPFTGERRLARFLAKLAANLGMVAVATLAVVSMPTSDALFAVLKTIFLIQFLIPLGLLLYQFFAVWVIVYRYLNSLYAVLYSGPDAVVPADAGVTASYFDNPFGRALTADWEAAGAKVVGNGTLENPVLQHAGFRFVATPDGNANAMLFAVKLMPNPDGTARNCHWPSLVFVKLLTRYRDDSSVATTNDLGSAFRRKLFGPEFLLRIHPDVADSAELLARHAESCRQHAGRTGQAPLPAMKFEEFARWNAEKSTQERRLYARNPVTWSDAFVLLMGYVRRAYR